jgi:hypothetical protein
MTTPLPERRLLPFTRTTDAATFSTASAIPSDSAAKVSVFSIAFS